MSSSSSLLQALRWKKHFEHKIVWITGASSGIGEQLAGMLSFLGARLILSARSAPGLERVRNNLPHPEHARILPLDLEQLDTQKFRRLMQWLKGGKKIIASTPVTHRPPPAYPDKTAGTPGNPHV